MPTYDYRCGCSSGHTGAGICSRCGERIRELPTGMTRVMHERYEKHMCLAAAQVEQDRKSAKVLSPVFVVLLVIGTIMGIASYLGHALLGIGIAAIVIGICVIWTYMVLADRLPSYQDLSGLPNTEKAWKMLRRCSEKQRMTESQRDKIHALIEHDWDRNPDDIRCREADAVLESMANIYLH